MIDNDKEILTRVIEKEGFDYAMVLYSAYDETIPFNHIRDEKFHELKKVMLAARTELIQYCRDNIDIDM